MSKQKRYLANYRAAELRHVMTWIKAGQCGCLIGLRGAGKSNFVRFLLQEDVRQDYLESEHPNFDFVHINLLSLTNYSDWAVYELILNCLLGQLHPTADIRSELTHLHQQVLNKRDAIAAQRALQAGIKILLKRPQHCLVLLFDEFDTVFQRASPTLLRSLKDLRDLHIDQLVYIVIVASDLSRTRNDLDEVEYFYRLVSRNVCALGPYTDTDARQMTAYLAAQRSLEFSQDELTTFVQLSGGHAGLLKTLVSIYWNRQKPLKPAHLALYLKDEPVLWAECQKIWVTLSMEEQEALRALPNKQKVKSSVLQSLIQKGLVRSNSSLPVFSPVFVEFIRQQMSTHEEGLKVDYATGQVSVDGRIISGLNDVEFELLCCLFERRGRVCTTTEILADVWRQPVEERNASKLLQRLIARLRRRIEPDYRQPRYIVTRPGKGYKLLEFGQSEGS